MKTIRRILRIVIYTLVVVVAAAVGALIVLTETERGRDNLAGIISSVASSADRKVTVSGIDGIWSGALSVDHVVLEDRQGPWLVLRQVAVDWSPLALLRKTFSADRIAAGRIEVARLPVSDTPASETDQGGATTLPVSVDIKRIDLPEIALGEALAGSGIAELAAKGSVHADASPLAIATDLNISRNDGKQGMVDASILFAPADNKLDLDLKASEPAGGIIANLLQLPDAPPVDIALSGKGPIADWSGAGTFAVAGQVVTRLSGRHQLTELGNRIEARGDGDFERFLPQKFKSLLAGSTSFDLAGTATKAGGVEIERASIDSDAVHATAAGTVDPAGASDLSVDLAAKGPPIVLSLGGDAQPVTVAIDKASARAFGDGKAPAVDIGVSLVSVVAGTTRLDDLIAQAHSDGFDIENRSGPLGIKLTASGLKTDVATLAPLVTGRLSADLAGTISKEEVSVDSGTLLSDALNASVTAKVVLADLSMSLAMKADATSTALPAQIRPLLGERVEFSATASRDPQGSFAANSLEFTSGSLSASGTGSISGGNLNADIKGTLGDVSPLSPLVGVDVGGGIGFELTANGAAATPDFSVSATSDRLSASGRAVSDVNLKASGTADIASPAATVSLTGDVEGQALRLDGALTTTDGQREVTGLSLSLGDSKVSGDLAIGEGFLPVGTLTLDVPDLGPLAALAEQSAAGDIKGTIRFARDGDIPTVAIDAASGSISRGDVAAKTIAVNAVIANYLQSPGITGTIKADSVASGSTLVSGIDVDLKQDGAWTGFSGGATLSDIPATIAGRVRIADGTTAVELNSGEATVRGIKAAIAEASTLTVANGAANVERLALDVGGGSVVVSGTAGENLDLTAELSALPAALANEFSPGLDAAGTLGATVRVSGPSSSPEIRFAARLADAETSQTRKAALGPLDLDAAGSYSTSGMIAIDQATLTGDKVTGKASGTINLNGASDFSLDLTSTGSSLPLSLGSAESPIDIEIGSVSLKATGETKATRLDISATLPSVGTKDAKVDGIGLTLHSDAFDVMNRAGLIAAKVTADRIGLDNATVAPLIAGQITAEVAGSLATDAIVIDKGSVRGDALNAGFGGRVSLTDGAIDLNIKADAVSAALPAAARPVLGERTELSAALKRDAAGNVSADDVRLSSGALSADGKASLTDGAIAADIKGALADLSLLSKDAQGAINFAIQADGASTAPDLSVTVDSDRLSVAEREITGLKLIATGKADLANPAADVSLTGDVAGQPLRGNAVLSTAQGSRAINGLSLSLGKNRISGDLALDDAFVPDGTVTFELPDIGPLAALALEKAEGDVRGTIRFSKKEGAPEVAVKATTAALSRGDIAAKGVSIDALIANYLAAPAISGKIRADGVTSGGTVVSGIDVDLKQDGEWTGFSGGATVKDIPAKAAGRVRLAGGATTIELASGEATLRGIRAAIAKPSTITIADGTTKIETLALDLGGGTATVSGTAGETLDIDARLAGVPLSLANSFSPGLAAAGSLSGTAKVTGAAANPTVKFDIDATGIQLAQTRSAGIGALGVSSSGTFAANKLSFDATISDGAGLGLKGGGTVTIAGTPDLSLNFSGPVPFSLLSEKLAAQGLSLTGAANVDVKVSGPATAPVISGSVSASGARLVDAGSGLAVNDINARVDIGGGVARITRLTGTLSTRGSLSVGGTVGIDPAQGFPADITVKLADGRYTDGKVVTANLSGDLTVKGPLVSAPVIAGTVELGRTVITVPDKLPGSLQALDVKHRNAPAAVRAQDEELRPASTGGGGGGGGLSLDITIRARNQIFVQGRGLDAELGGGLKLTGPASAPQAVGKFTLRRGRLSILGKRLNFTEGTLTFAGSLVPFIDLTAVSTATDATVTILVSGEATDPKFTFSSVPALPEDEVLARLIFGRSMSNLSPLQIAQLAEAAAQLAGVGGSTSLLQNLRNAIGVDDLDVTTDEQGGTAVSAGKYLNDRTYVTIQKGEKPGSGKAAIDLNVGRGVKLRGEASDAGEAKGGIFYEREY